MGGRRPLSVYDELTAPTPSPPTHQIIGDEIAATAILDRLLHHCEVVSINGNNYRLKSRLQAIERETDVG